MPGVVWMAGQVTVAPIEWHDELGSTQDEAHALAVARAAHGTAVATRIQTRGRGTRGREWMSGKGGLWLSVVCRPDGGAAVEVIGLRVGLALAALIDKLLPPPHHVSLKWPNDLYLMERKLGGILVEARWQGESLGWMVIGVGLNVRNEIPASLAWSAVSLADAGVPMDPAELATPVAQAVARSARAASPLNPAELRAFADRDWLRGKTVALPTPGVAEGITPEGRLMVRTLGGALIEVTSPVQLESEA